MTKGSILEVKGLSPDTSREDIKKTFLEYDLTVNWVDLETGQTEVSVKCIVVPTVLLLEKIPKCSVVLHQKILTLNKV